ncbi:MAG: hypothetical protein A2X22_09250 [Bacteroidetes bacterium GWF2_49_14]|nr:MAG: hypothetical protein A2X22_09250 [Bacteroidetes bacterium GWF2_49_14]
MFCSLYQVDQIYIHSPDSKTRTMKLSVFALFILMLAVQPASPQQTRTITPDELKTWVYYLASDEMKGRRNGSPEMLQAAQYISDVFRGAGLRPAVGDTSFFQEYSVKDRNNVTIHERNVVGILEGTNPVLKNEWILVSAHFDHVGIRQPVDGDSIYNGADDNATGTATVMALARLLTQPENRPQRSVLFAAWSGEESGMNGSRWFLGHPVIPIEQLKLNLNFEMTGEFKTLGDHLFIITGYLFTDFDDLVGKYTPADPWKVATQMQTPPGVFFASDNATFAFKRNGDKTELNIPAFTLVTTDDMNLIHKPSDEPEKMDYVNMASFVNYAAGLITWLAAGELKISWDRGAFEEFLKK